MAYRLPIQQPLDLSGPGSMLLSEYCTSEKATLRTILNYVLRSQSRIPAIQDIPSNEFEKLLKQVSCYNRFISFRIPKVLKKLSVINNKFISAEISGNIQNNDKPMCTCGGKVVCTLASSFYSCIDCAGFIKMLN